MSEYQGTKLKICSSLKELSLKAAAEIAEEARTTLKRKKSFTFVLSGGKTPVVLYQLLATEYREKIQWEGVHLFWSDERYVPHADPDSNYRLARQSLIDAVPIPPSNIHPVPTNLDSPEQSASAYDEILKRFFGGSGPAFDVMLLGIGTDGHTASLFPKSPALKEKKRWVVPSVAPARPKDRITMTFPAMNASRNVFFLGSGKEKSPVVEDILRGGSKEHDRHPAANVHGTEQTVWFLDIEAAGKLR